MKKIYIFLLFMFMCICVPSSGQTQQYTKDFRMQDQKQLNKNIDSLKLKRDSTQYKRKSLYQQLDQNSKSLDLQTKKIDSLINKRKK